jgi:chitinase
LILVLLVPGFVPARAEENATLPRYVVYYNSDTHPATALIGLPYTHVILSFVTVGDVSDDEIKLVIDPRLDNALPEIGALQADGKKVLLSFGGGAMEAGKYLKVVERVNVLADALINIVDEHGFDGIDIDFEVSAALQETPPSDSFDGRKFMIDLTLALRKRLGEGPILSHAPQPPYLDPAWHGGPYIEILKQAGDAIDWIAVQYYNNPAFDAPVPADIIGAAHRPKVTSYAGIASGAVGFKWSSDKTLVGLPIYHADASNGHLAPDVVDSEVVCPLVARYGDAFGGLAGGQFSTGTDDHQYWNTQLAPPFQGDGCGS